MEIVIPSIYGAIQILHTDIALPRIYIESGHDIRIIHDLLGHTDLNTIMVYTHVVTINRLGVKSPLD